MKSVPSSHRRLRSRSGAGILAVLAAIAATLLCLPQSHAQTEVPAGSALRKSLFELARPSVESEAGQKVLFEGSLKQLGEWAFFMDTSPGDELDREAARLAELWRWDEGSGEAL